MNDSTPCRVTADLNEYLTDLEKRPTREETMASDEFQTQLLEFSKTCFLDEPHSMPAIHAMEMVKTLWASLIEIQTNNIDATQEQTELLQDVVSVPVIDLIAKEMAKDGAISEMFYEIYKG